MNYHKIILILNDSERLFTSEVPYDLDEVLTAFHASLIALGWDSEVIKESILEKYAEYNNYPVNDYGTII